MMTAAKSRLRSANATSRPTVVPQRISTPSASITATSRAMTSRGSR